MRTLSCHIAAVMLVMISAGGALGQELRLVAAGGSEILPGGVLAGDLVIRNDTATNMRLLGCPSQAAGNINFHISNEAGARFFIGRFSLADPRMEAIELSPGAELRVPFCLIKKDGVYFFREPGRYSVRAVYETPVVSEGAMTFAKVQSDTLAVIVAGDDRAFVRYADAQAAFDIFAPYEVDLVAMRLVGSDLAEYGPYAAEQAKFVLYQVGWSSVRRYVKCADGVADDFTIAEAMIQLSRKYQIKAPIWESLLRYPKGADRESQAAVAKSESRYFYY